MAPQQQQEALPKPPPQPTTPRRQQQQRPLSPPSPGSGSRTAEATPAAAGLAAAAPAKLLDLSLQAALRSGATKGSGGGGCGGGGGRGGGGASGGTKATPAGTAGGGSAPAPAKASPAAGPIGASPAAGAATPLVPLSPAAAAALAASKLGLADQLSAALSNAGGGKPGSCGGGGAGTQAGPAQRAKAQQRPKPGGGPVAAPGLAKGVSNPLVGVRDQDGRCCLHFAAGYGHDDCVDLLLAQDADPKPQDNAGDTPLHFAAVHGQPMCTYSIAKQACPKACTVRNARGQRPLDVASACGRGEVLNAMLLACSGSAGDEAQVEVMKELLSAGAVPDTWAPNGSSALMQAAGADAVAALGVLLEGGASVELQDALGRSALMFAAGSGAAGAAAALLDAGAAISARDRRGRAALDYAPKGSAAEKLLRSRLAALEEVAAARQAELLELLGCDGDGKCKGVGKGAGSCGKSTTSSGTAAGRAAAGAQHGGGSGGGGGGGGGGLGGGGRGGGGGDSKAVGKGPGGSKKKKGGKAGGKKTADPGVGSSEQHSLVGPPTDGALAAVAQRPPAQEPALAAAAVERSISPQDCGGVEPAPCFEAAPPLCSAISGGAPRSPEGLGPEPPPAAAEADGQLLDGPSPSAGDAGIGNEPWEYVASRADRRAAMAAAHRCHGAPTEPPSPLPSCAGWQSGSRRSSSTGSAAAGRQGRSCCPSLLSPSQSLLSLPPPSVASSVASSAAGSTAHSGGAAGHSLAAASGGTWKARCGLLRGVGGSGHSLSSLSVGSFDSRGDCSLTGYPLNGVANGCVHSHHATRPGAGHAAAHATPDGQHMRCAALHNCQQQQQQEQPAAGKSPSSAAGALAPARPSFRAAVLGHSQASTAHATPAAAASAARTMGPGAEPSTAITTRLPVKAASAAAAGDDQSASGRMNPAAAPRSWAERLSGPPAASVQPPQPPQPQPPHSQPPPQLRAAADLGDSAPGDAEALEAARQENRALKNQIARMSAAHQRQLANVLSDAAAHEAAVVHQAAAASAAMAAATERGRWISLLQALGVPPPLLLQIALGDAAVGASGWCCGEQGLPASIAAASAPAEEAVAEAAASGVAGELPQQLLDQQLMRAMHFGGCCAAATPPCKLLFTQLVAPPLQRAARGAVSSDGLSDNAPVLGHLRGEYTDGGSCFVAPLRCSSPGSVGSAHAWASEQARICSESCASSGGGRSDCDGLHLPAWELDPVVPSLPAAATQLPAIGSECPNGVGSRRHSGAGVGAAPEDGVGCFLPEDLL